MTRLKRMHILSISAVIVIVSWTASAAVLKNSESFKHWHQWRGPLQSGVAPQGDPPTEWSETKNVKWKVKIPGDGDATPIIWGDKVFVLSAVATGRKLQAAAS